MAIRGATARPEPQAFRTGFISGLDDRIHSVTQLGQVDDIMLNFEPLVARRLLGVPMSSLAGRVVSIEDVLGTAAKELVERLGETGLSRQRFEIVDDFLGQRWKAARDDVRPDIAWAVRSVMQDPGRQIDSLRSELGYSHRLLVARFREAVGFSPRAFARLVRFTRLVTELKRSTAVDWASLAIGLGYYDQPHLSHEVRGFVHMTPSQLQKRLQGTPLRGRAIIELSRAGENASNVRGKG